MGAQLVCADCGAVDYRTSFSGSIKKLMDAHGICFTCGYWRKRLEKKPEVVIKGRIYSLGDVRKPPNQPHAGMAGRRFDIEFFDGRRVTTHDLWSGSDIPDRYRAQLPDNARFLGGAGFVRIGNGGAWNPSRPQTASTGDAA